jgi:hypothetical protein
MMGWILTGPYPDWLFGFWPVTVCCGLLWTAIAVVLRLALGRRRDHWT